MKTIFRLAVLVLLLSGWALAASAIYVIRTPTTITVVSRDRLGCPWEDVFVDTRAWTMQDVGRHRQIVRRLIALDRASLLANVADPDSKATVEAQLRDAVAAAERSAQTNQQAGSTEPLSVGRAVSMLDIAWGESNPSHNSER